MGSLQKCGKQKQTAGADIKYKAQLAALRHTRTAVKWTAVLKEQLAHKDAVEAFSCFHELSFRHIQADF